MNTREYQPRPFEVIDTTLRDGLQSPWWADTGKFYPSTQDKLDIAEALMRYGVRFLEVFSPLVNGREKSDLGLIIAHRNALAQDLNYPTYILAHVRCHPRDVEEALKFPIDGLNLYMGTSEQSREHNHKKTLEGIIATARPLLDDLRRNYPTLLLRFSGEDAFRTPINDLFTVYDPIAELVDMFGSPDTVGAANPKMVMERIEQLRERYPRVRLEGHFHNDRGLSLVNAITAVKAGMQYVDTSVLGLAERSGISSLTALIFNLFLEDPNLIDGFDLSLSYPLNVLVADILHTHVPTTEPVSLTNRTHSAGVHTGAVINNATVYEAHNLARFGVNEQRLLLNPLSGKHIIGYYLREILYFTEVTDDIAEKITTTFKIRVGEISTKKTPNVLLNEIATDFGLVKKDIIGTHVENLSTET